MATSGYRNVTVTEWDTLRFTWNLASQDYAKNTSVVTWTLQLISGTYGQISSTAKKAWSVTINGTKYIGTNTVGIGNNETKTLASGSITIAHGADGTKTFSFSFSQEFGITFDGASIGTMSGSGTGTLTTIPRASQPSLITWPETTNDVGDFGDTISIHMNRNSSAFTHTVRYAFGSLTGTIATGVTTGTTWTIPLSFMDLLPAATKGSGLIYVDTYNGSTLVGTKYTGFTANVPASVRPTCSLQVLDATDVKDTYGNLVRGRSRLLVRLSGGTAYSSPIASYRASANGSTYTAAEFTTDVLHNAGTITVTATVTDKRGRTSEARTASFPVLDYAAPAISSLSVHRCDEDGTENDQGENVKVNFDATITSLNSKNSATYKVRHKASTATSYTEVELTDLEGQYTVTGGEYIFAASSDNSFDVEVTAADDFGTATRATSASTAFSLFNVHPDGTGWAFGKVAEKSNTLEIALDVEFTGKVKGAIFDVIYPVGSIYLAYNHTNPATLFGGTWTRIQNAFLWATTSTGTIGQTGGEREVALTVDEMPAHTHFTTVASTTTGSTAAANTIRYNNNATTFVGSIEGESTGGGAAHNNMPPYIQVSVWRRTA